MVDAQTAHFFIALWLVSVATGYGGQWWLGLALVVPLAAIKEFGFDIICEGDGWPDSVQDFIAYIAGATLMTSIIWLFPFRSAA